MPNVKLDNLILLFQLESSIDLGIQKKPEYRKILNISPGLINICKHFLEGLYTGGFINGRLIFGGHFVLVSGYQDLNLWLYVEIIDNKGVSLGQNHFYFALKPIQNRPDNFYPITIDMFTFFKRI